MDKQSFPAIRSVSINGFRSLADVQVRNLSNLVVLIGSNGSGKSNFIRFFDMVAQMIGGNGIQHFTYFFGGADDQLFGGNAVTPRMSAFISMVGDNSVNDYRFALDFAHPDRFAVVDEYVRFTNSESGFTSPWDPMPIHGKEAPISLVARYPDGEPGVIEQKAGEIVDLFKRVVVYHFQNTSDTSGFKKYRDVTDHYFLRADGSNLAPILYRLATHEPRIYARICSYICRVLPGFQSFALDTSNNKIMLRWTDRFLAKTFDPHLTSDGSLRFFALATVLNLPSTMLPDVLLLDEPELGMHPAAVALLGGMIRSLSARKQVIVATQSPLLVNAFELDEVIVFDRLEGRTVCCQFDKADYVRWLEDGYRSGDLWWKNLLGGYP